MHKNIVYFSSIPWEFLYQRPQHILTGLKKRGYKVLYISSAISSVKLKTQIIETKNTINIILGLDFNIKKIKKIIQETDKIITILTVAEIDQKITNINSINKPSVITIVKTIELFVKLLNISKINVMTNQPYWLPIIKKINFCNLIYDCLDDISGFSGHDNIILLENELIKTSNIIFCTAKELLIKCLSLNENSFFIPNGVEFYHFNKAINEQYSIPEDLKNITGHLIGYIGCIGDWFDLNLIISLANKNPNYSFILIGPITMSSFSNFNIPKNIYFLGKKDYSDLPKYLKYLKITIIPFKICSLTTSTDPVKLYEYLAAGKSVISTQLPEVRKYAPLVKICNGPEDFSIEIKQLLLNPQNPLDLVELVKNETWEKRLDLIEKTLNNF